MGRKKIKSPTRTISNKGPEPRFVGFFPCHKAISGYLPYDSIPALDCGIYLEWRSDIVRIDFEPEKYHFKKGDGTRDKGSIPDYRAILATGEIEVIEAKSSDSVLRDSDREQLNLVAATCAQRGENFRIVHRDQLHLNGFLDTILLLRPHGWMNPSLTTIELALARFGVRDATTIEEWRRIAVSAGIPISMLYHLLYRQRVPLVYRPLLFTELLRWRD